MVNLLFKVIRKLKKLPSLTYFSEYLELPEDFHCSVHFGLEILSNQLLIVAFSKEAQNSALVFSINSRISWLVSEESQLSKAFSLTEFVHLFENLKRYNKLPLIR